MMTTLLNNRYQVIEVLGVGGFGETFLAEDVYMPSRRRCVIKQLKPMTNDPKIYPLIQQRFGREAAILEKMGEGSSRIPKLYAYFCENGQFYLVQEWISGQTITNIVEAKGRLSETAVRDIVASLLSVLDYVHGEGIIHRDIKPDNIILRHSNGLPILIDFGAVKETIANVSYTQAKINPSMVLGTPGFMSPEQAAGRPSYSSDVYSLGLTAIYMLTGKLPQELEIDPQTGQLVWQQYAFDVSPSLIAVLDKAVQSHPRDRYSTAKKMLLDLQSDVSTSSVPPTTKATVILPHQHISSQPEPVKSPPVVALNKPFNQKKWLHNLILGILAGGLLGTIAVVGLVRNQSTSTSDQPIATTTESDAATKVDESPAPVTSPQPQTEQQNTPIPTPSVTQTPLQTQQNTDPTPATSPQPQTEQQNTPIPTPATSPPQPQTEQQTPIPTPSVTQIPSEPQNQNNSDNTDTNSVPGFPIGTSESRVKAVLGNPTQVSRGIWGNTRAYVYDIKPNQITLGYLFDRNSGQLRQTEVSFAQSVAVEQMQATLQEMLGGDFINVNQGLQRVYQRRDRNYTFNTGELKVAIERNERDRIYIGVWDADLH